MSRLRLAGIYALIAAISTISSAAGPASQVAKASAVRPKYREHAILVRFRPGGGPQTMAATHAKYGATVVRQYSTVPGLQLLRFPDVMSITKTLQSLRREPNVAYAEPDYAVHTQLAPNDPRYVDGTQWDMNNTGQSGGKAGADIDAPEAWNITTGSSNVVVATIDTGMDYNHPDLVANLYQLESNCHDGIDNDGNGYVDDCYGIAPVYGSTNPFDDYDHGTHVAGTIGARANNATGVAGVNWQVGLVACKFLDYFGEGYDSDAITCLEYIKDLKDNRGVNIIATNNSWGGGGYSQALYDAIDAQRQSGILFIAAAGNFGLDNDGGFFYPADYDLANIIPVAATDRSDLLADFSDFGRHTVALGAPGVFILSTTPNNTYSIFSGTSMATPHVTGVAALLKAQDPARDWKTIKNLIIAGGDPIPSLDGKTISGKRLDANGSLTCSNQQIFGRMQPVTDEAVASVGIPVPIKVLNIDCGTPNGDVTVNVDPGGIVLTLKDDGAGSDQDANDGIYSGSFTPVATGTYTATIASGGSFKIRIFEPYYSSPQPLQYRDITGTSLNFNGDESALITPGFSVQFGGQSLNSLHVNVNGTITIAGPNYDLPTSLPSANAEAVIAPFWDDLYPFTGNVYWQETGTAPNREVVVEWRDMTTFQCVIEEAEFGGDCEHETVRFQTVFSEASSDVLFNYADVTFGGFTANENEDRGAGATIGVQVGPASANVFSQFTGSLIDGVALRWTTVGPDTKAPVPAITSVTPSPVTPGVSFDMNITGSNFVPFSVVRLDGVNQPITFVDSSHLSVAAAAVPSPGTSTVTVFNFTGGESNPSPLSTSDFTLDVPVPTSTVVAGAAATYLINVSPVNGSFDTNITFSCSSLPTHTTCSYSSASLNPGGSMAQTTLTLTTKATQTSSIAPAPTVFASLTALPAFAFMLPGLLLLPGRRGQSRMRLLGIIIVITIAVSLSGCGGAGAQQATSQHVSVTIPGTPAGTYNVGVVASTATYSRTTHVQLTVQ